MRACACPNVADRETRNRFGDKSDGPVLKGCGYGPNCFSTTGDPEVPTEASVLVTEAVLLAGPPDHHTASAVEDTRWRQSGRCLCAARRDSSCISARRAS